MTYVSHYSLVLYIFLLYSRSMHKEMIWFQTTRKGRRQAYRWDKWAFQAIRMRVADAEMRVATGQAQEIDGHPLKG